MKSGEFTPRSKKEVGIDCMPVSRGTIGRSLAAVGEMLAVFFQNDVSHVARAAAIRQSGHFTDGGIF